MEEFCDKCHVLIEFPESRLHKIIAEEHFSYQFCPYCMAYFDRRIWEMIELEREYYVVNRSLKVIAEGAHYLNKWKQEEQVTFSSPQETDKLQTRFSLHEAHQLAQQYHCEVEPVFLGK